jgi:hypothetical protein
MSRLIGTVRSVPRFVVGRTMQTARLPIAALARVTGQRDNDEWLPLVAFEGVEAIVETTVGSLLRDDSLVSRGRLRSARVTKLREAARLEAIAEQTRADADDELERRRAAAERRREKAERTAQQREAQIEQQAASKKQSARQSAAASKEALATQVDAAEEAVEREERTGRIAATEAQAEALEKERAAVAAEDRALEADEQIEASREARASS